MEKKSRYNQSQNKSTQKYLAANMEQVRFWVKKGERQKVKDKADVRGLSLAQYLIHAVNTLEGEQVLTPTEKQESDD